MKILMVDDHQLIREGLRPVLSGLGEAGEETTVLEAASFAQGLQLAAEHRDLDLALLDLHLPDASGLAALADLLEGHPDLPVVVLSGEDDPALMRDVLEQGALGFIPKSSSSAVIVQALRLVLSGGTYVPREAMAASPPAVSQQQQAQPRAPREVERLGLTPRQADVLGLLLAGKSNKIICRELNLAEGTVKNHVGAVLRALNAANRLEAVVAAQRLGIKP
jgi:DNA-binding NarL/FixJ family response regulator